MDKVAKGFTLSIIHSGINKCILEATTIEVYKMSYRGILGHLYLIQNAAIQSSNNSGTPII